MQYTETMIRVWSNVFVYGFVACKKCNWHTS